MKKLFFCALLMVSMLVACTPSQNPAPEATASESLPQSVREVQTPKSSAVTEEQNIEESMPAEDLPIDIDTAVYPSDVDWSTTQYTHDLYSFAMPEGWQAMDGSSYGLADGVFLLPPDTDMEAFPMCPNVAIEVAGSRPDGGAIPDFSDEAVQKEFFAAQIISTYAKMGGLSDLEFSVWESEFAYVYIASFKRSNDELTMYQTTYYVMNPERMFQVQASHFGEDADPGVNEVARHLINTLA